MNYHTSVIIKKLIKKKYTNQRHLAKDAELSLGLVNQTVNELMDGGYLTEKLELTDKTYTEFHPRKPERAVILAAGYGLRMVPIGSEIPKALLEVKGEVLIERQIRQLKEKGVKEIYVVVGYLKEMFDYLIDEFGVHLIYNKDYDTKNNLFTLALAAEHIKNAYIVPCDVYAFENPFEDLEFYSWYMMGKEEALGTGFKVSRSGVIKRVKEDQKGNRVLGITYLNEEVGEQIKVKILQMIEEDVWSHSFWEEALFMEESLSFLPKIVTVDQVVEINSYMDLRAIDAESDHLNSSVLHYIAKELNCTMEDINHIFVMKKGMTNRSFQFSVKEKKYIMRLPGEGTEDLINRHGEQASYEAMKGLNISDKVVALCPEKGYKITEFFENTRECDPENWEEVSLCMGYLKDFHEKELSVPHTFDLFGSILFYESLWTRKTLYKDYEKVKEAVFSLKSFIDSFDGKHVLSHIDAVPDNFLFTEEGIRLIDWEYAGMQDPHVDIAMFAIYALYDKEDVDRLIQSYFNQEPDQKIIIKIYAYIAICGLLWSNWCEYKRMLGVEFGEYSLKQYRYAKEYANLVRKYLEKEGKHE